jgi:uncharacterized membrane protein
VSQENDRLSNIVSAVLDAIAALYTILRNYFLAGVILLVPVGVTLFITLQLFSFADSILGNAVSKAMGRQIPGVGLVSTIFICVMAGMFAQNIIGRRLLRWMDISLQSLPVVRSLYVGAKQVSDVLFQKHANEFQRVVLVEYPKEDSWVLAFVTGDFPISLTPKKFSPGSLLCVFVPTTPNPTSGFLLIIDKSKVIDMTMGVEEALKIIISGGLVKPEGAGLEHHTLLVEDFTIPR